MFRLVPGHRIRVGAAAREPALAALGLGQHRVHLIGDGIAFHVETDSRIAQEQPEECGERGEGDDGGQHVKTARDRQSP